MKYITILTLVLINNLSSQNYEWEISTHPQLGMIPGIYFYDEQNAIAPELLYGYLHSQNRGVDWNWEFVENENNLGFFFDYSAINNTVYLAGAEIDMVAQTSYGRVVKVIGKGEEYEILPPKFPDPLEEIIFIDENKAITLDNKFRLFYSDDGFQSYSDSLTLFVEGNYIENLEYFNDKLYGFNYDGYIYISDDFGFTWNLRYKFEDRKLNGLSYYNSTLYLSCNDGYILTSTNDGQAWNEIKIGENILAGVKFQGQYFGVAYGDARESAKIYITQDGGVTWNEEETPKALYYDAYISSDDRLFLTGYHITAENPSQGLIVSGEKVTNVDYMTSNLLNIYPNPVASTLNIEFSSTQGSFVNAKIGLFDLMGRELITINPSEINYSNGIGSISTNVENINPGYYYLRIIEESKTFTKPIIIE